jgi:hypothetical protein
MPEGIARIPVLCRVSAREGVFAGEAVLLLLGLGLALVRGLRFGCPLGHLARSASTSIARHFVPFHQSIQTSRTIYRHFIGCMTGDTLAAIPLLTLVLSNRGRLGYTVLWGG